MEIILHRRNTLEDLKSTPEEFGVEIDIRSFGKRLILNHEPFEDALDLEEWLRCYKHKTLILNIKEEGIEQAVRKVIQGHGIKDYFFLDLSFPALVKMVNASEKNIALRFSEYESIETVLKFSGKAAWVWVDSFMRLPLTKENHPVLARHFKLCLVSPELQGRDHSEIKQFKDLLAGLKIDAVCTKYPDLWK